MSARPSPRRVLLFVVAVVVLLAWSAALVPSSSAGIPGDPDQLNPPLDEERSVAVFRLSPDGTRVVYSVGDRDSSAWRYELFSVPIGGGPSVKLGPSDLDDRISMGGSGSGFRITEDSAWVLARLRTIVGDDGDANLYATPIQGGTPVMLNDPLEPGHSVGQYEVSPDLSTVVYQVVEDPPWPEPDVHALYSKTTGSPAVRLTDPLVERGTIKFFLVSPDWTTVMFRADTTVEDVNELFTVPVGGGTVQRLLDPLPPEESILSDVDVSPDWSTVVYEVVRKQYLDPGWLVTVELFSKALNGGAAISLAGPVEVTDEVGFHKRVSSDWSTVVYSHKAENKNRSRLFSVPVAGGTPTKLNGPLQRWGDVMSFALTPDATTVLYRADAEVNNMVELYAVPIDGGTPVKLNGPLPGHADVADGFRIAADSTRAVFLADIQSNELFDAYSVPTGGGDPTQLTDGVDVFDVKISQDSRWFTFKRRYEATLDVFSLPLSGGTTVTLNSPLPDGGRVDSALITPDSSRVVFTADNVDDEAFNLFVVDIRHRCAGSFATIVGTAGADTLVGSTGPDVIHGLGGGDSIQGKGGGDIICGGSGDDVINGGLGPDTIYGNKGDDVIRGYKGADMIFAGKGRDTAYGGPGHDTVAGGKRADTVRGGPGNDALSGNRGDDELRGGPGIDTCDGGTGTDTAFGCETATAVP